MFLEATSLLKLPVAALDTESKVGSVNQIIIDPDNGSVLGFLISTGGFLEPKKVLSAVDVRDWDPKGLVTASYENIVDIKDVVRIKDILDNGIQFIGMGARTETGKNLGRVEDLLIDTETQYVTKYYLKDLLGHERVFPADKVIKIDKKIIFSDDVAEVPPGAAGVTA